MACVSAALESLTPHIITSQKFSLGPRAAQKAWYLFWTRTDLMMKSNTKPCISEEMFFDSLETVLLPNLAELPRLDEFAEELTLVLTANCPSHISCVVT
jgi:hypothetical protein